MPKAPSSRRSNGAAWSLPAVAGLLAIAPAAAHAPPADPQSLAPPPNLAALATLNGTCSKLIVGGEDLSSKCSDLLLNAAYRTGNSSFMFAARGMLAVSFFGPDSKAVGDRATLTVRQITMTREGEPPKPAMLPATGSCEYTNPYAGPSHISCTATAGGKTYSAQFVSDGQPPKIDRFDR